MIILIEFDGQMINEVNKILSNTETHRDGPGFRSIIRPSYYFPLNEAKTYPDGSSKLLFEVGLGGKDDFYKNVIDKLKDQHIPISVQEFKTNADAIADKHEDGYDAYNLSDLVDSNTSNRSSIFTRINPFNSKRWYSVWYKDDTSNEWSKENDLIFAEAEKLSIECGWFQTQGSRLIWVHCTSEKVLSLIAALNESHYSYTELNEITVKLIKSNRRNYSIPTMHK